MLENNHKVISVNYTLFIDNEKGELVESTVGREPLVFLSGVGAMIPDFEKNVVSLNVGEEFAFGIKAIDAYGERSDDAIVNLEKEMFVVDGKLAEEIVVDNIIQLQDQNGQVHLANILEIGDSTIKFDVNHPLAGEDLFFKGEVLEIRKATDEEVAHGHVHGPGGHHH